MVLIGILFTTSAAFQLHGRRIAIISGLVLDRVFIGTDGAHEYPDTGLSGTMTTALCSPHHRPTRRDATETERRNYMLPCWAGMALATMSKGLIDGFAGRSLSLHGLMRILAYCASHMGKGLLLFLCYHRALVYLVWRQTRTSALFIHEHFNVLPARCINAAVRPGITFPLLVIGIVPCGVLYKVRASYRKGKNEISANRKCSCYGLVSFFSFSLAFLAQSCLLYFANFPALADFDLLVARTTKSDPSAN